MLQAYNSDLANGLGNLVARTAKLCENNNIEAPLAPTKFDPKMTIYLEQYKFNEALAHIWSEIAVADKKISDEKPWELEGEQAKTILLDIVAKIQHIAFNLQPFMPATAEKILKQFSGKIVTSEPLFPRIA
jgi:methionyl-tRNA synthetase